MSPMKDKVRPLLVADAADYAKKKRALGRCAPSPAAAADGRRRAAPGAGPLPRRVPRGPRRRKRPPRLALDEAKVLSSGPLPPSRGRDREGGAVSLLGAREGWVRRAPSPCPSPSRGEGDDIIPRFREEAQWGRSAARPALRLFESARGSGAKRRSRGSREVLDSQRGQSRPSLVFPETPMSDSAAAMLTVDNIEVVYDHVRPGAEGGCRSPCPRAGWWRLLGANGAGKTTTLKAISNLLHAERGEVTKGKIVFEGEEVQDLSPNDLVRRGCIQVMEGAALFSATCRSRTICSPAPSPAPMGRSAVRADLERCYELFPAPETAAQVAGGAIPPAANSRWWRSGAP